MTRVLDMRKLRLDGHQREVLRIRREIDGILRTLHTLTDRLMNLQAAEWQARHWTLTATDEGFRCRCRKTFSRQHQKSAERHGTFCARRLRAVAS